MTDTNNTHNAGTPKGRSNQNALFLWLFAAAALVWLFLFRHFMSGAKNLADDGVAYFGHVVFYLDSIGRGVYPFWDPTRDFGTPNEFYLRRFGEFNPLFLPVLGLHKMGMDWVIAYRLFLAGYFFLGVGGFYALCRRLWAQQSVAAASALMFMFSSVGTLSFGSYLMLTLTPMLWFFYFCIAFAQSPARRFCVGMTFCAMLLLITYVPFYFLTVLMIIALVWAVVYPRECVGVLKNTWIFVCGNRLLSCVCVLALASAFIPGALWYKEAARGESMSPPRHIESVQANTATIGIERANEGGIIASEIFAHVLSNLDNLHLNELYIPTVAVLFLLCGVWTMLNRRLVFFFLAGWLIYMVGVTDASPVYKFLFNHVFFFRYFRNLQFFIWLGILPLFILFIGEQMRLLIEMPAAKRGRMLLSAYIIAVHSAAAAYVFTHDGAVAVTYIVLAISLGVLLGMVHGRLNPLIVAVGMLVALTIEAVPVYAHLDNYYPWLYQQTSYNRDYLSIKLPEVAPQPWSSIKDNPMKGIVLQPPYFGVRWLFPVMAKVPHGPLLHNWERPFILYDHVEGMDDGRPDFPRLSIAISDFQNIAFVPSADAAEAGALNNDNGSLLATIVTRDFSGIRIQSNSVNELRLRTHLDHPQFLVRNMNYYANWHAFVDGKEVRLYRANMAVQGVWVPAGEHEVLFRYATPMRHALSYALIFIFTGMCALLIWLGIKRL